MGLCYLVPVSLPYLSTGTGFRFPRQIRNPSLHYPLVLPDGPTKYHQSNLRLAHIITRPLPSIMVDATEQASLRSGKASTIIYRYAALAAAAGSVAFIAYWAYNIRLVAIQEYGIVIHEFDPYFNYRATEVRALQPVIQHRSRRAAALRCRWTPILVLQVAFNCIATVGSHDCMTATNPQPPSSLHAATLPSHSNSHALSHTLLPCRSTCTQMDGGSSFRGSTTWSGIPWAVQSDPPSTRGCNSLPYGSSSLSSPVGRSTTFAASFQLGSERLHPLWLE